MEILLEIGLEELPARFLKAALKDIETRFKKACKENRLNIGEISTCGTPRRLVLTVKDLDDKQEDLDQTNTGPAKHIAFTENGEPTKAGMGFAKSQGIDIKDLKIIKTDKGEYVAASKFLKGEASKNLLPKILKNLITTMTFSKSMRWGEKKMRFARPIRWILAMADSQLLEFEIEGLKTDLKTNGHRFFGSENIEVKNIEDYFEKLRENNVIVDLDERKEKIRKLIDEKCSKVGEKVLIDEALLDEVTNIIESPYPIVGTFNAEFLEVPQEVLIITMQTHQKYFPIVDDQGKLLPKFVVIRNGIEYSENVKKGNEIVLSARLADARFFYQEDLKKSLDEFAEKLNTVVFQRDLGTIGDKLSRIKLIAEKIGLDIKLSDEERMDVKRTVEIAKSDLVSNMISEKEYTKLQGFMGQSYALQAGEKENVAKGIFEHYLPRYQGDILPETNEGALTAISDKMDTITGCFGIGLIPSGSQDPYALRRAALGIVNIILNSKYDISLFEIIERSISIYEEKTTLKRTKTEVFTEVKEFFKQRLIKVLVDKGNKKETVEAVISANFENLIDVEKRVEVLTKISKEKDFDGIVKLIKRVANIAKDHDSTIINTEILKQTEEKDLYDYYKLLEKNSIKFINGKLYEKFLLEILSGKEIINSFFDKVMVMDEDEEIKNNRLALMKSLEKLFNKIAYIDIM